MNDGIFESIGIDPAFVFIGFFVIIIVLFVLLILQGKKIKTLTRQYDRFMRGNDAETLEDSILSRFDEVDELKEKDKKKADSIKKIFDNLQIAYQKTGIVKYNAFKEMGGNLSFVIALLDKNNDGFILNSMHSREGCYTYLKEIVKGESFVVLAEEEKQALDTAMNVSMLDE